MRYRMCQEWVWYVESAPKGVSIVIVLMTAGTPSSVRVRNCIDCWAGKVGGSFLEEEASQVGLDKLGFD